MDGVPLPLQGGSLLFTTKFAEIPGTHFVDLGATGGFEQGTLGFGIQLLNH